MVGVLWSLLLPGVPVGVFLTQLLPVVPVYVLLAHPLPAVLVTHLRKHRRPVRLLLPGNLGLGYPRSSVGGGPGVASSAAASGSTGASDSVGNRRMYGIKSLSWKALWNLREILGGRLNVNERGPISASMMKGSEALGANGRLWRSWFRGCFAALTRTRCST